VVCSKSENAFGFALPQPFEQALSITGEFEAATLKATEKDLFIDYWEKVS
jgi:hypothetical protein